jgi:uncharacterized membrane protein
MNQNNKNELKETILGVLEVFGINFLLFYLPSIVLAIGIFQLIYVIPRGIYLFKHKNQARLKGIIIGAVIIFFLNGACWLYFFSLFKKF